MKFSSKCFAGLLSSGLCAAALARLDSVCFQPFYISLVQGDPSTYDHRVWRTGLPVRSAVLKPHAGRLVVGWVTTSKSLLLYVFWYFFYFSYPVCLSWKTWFLLHKADQTDLK
ncbi:hypothetical protein N7462_009336 [Penicillium macrosclerotiorum]|uniref:uncharacterized protein n=1 Tax=Penicillium macrosclerotiorum TaxID=303699 RepID=UPI0025480445|nr:uncharacterized protein N7462_009336 [Penicillium macrosclerotiorum]KAJ5673897.1 hypothetical protein N7462_009336 [Penicillium macrosclerotiorum]